MTSAQLVGREREERDAEADQAVGAHLQQRPREHHRAARRGLHVGVGEPRVEREERHLDGEGEREEQEEPRLVGRRRHELEELDVVGREHAAVDRLARREPEPQQRDEHQQRPDERVDDELRRRIDAVLRAPDADDEVHRDQRELEEDVEEHHVERREHARHAALEQEQERVEGAVLLADVRPRAEHDDRPEQRRQHHEQQVDAVDADEVRHVEGREPVQALDELRPVGVRVEAEEERNREQERRHRDREGGVADGVRALEKRHGDRADERQEDQDRDQVRHRQGRRGRRARKKKATEGRRSNAVRAGRISVRRTSAGRRRG